MTTALDVAPAVTPSVEAESRLVFGLPKFDLAIVVMVVAFVVFVYPQANIQYWGPPMTLTWLVAPTCIVALAWRAITGDRISRCIALLAAWCVLTSLASTAPINSLIGSIGRSNSALAFVCGLGCCVLGRELSDAGRTALARAVVWAAGLSGAVAVMQVIVQPASGFLAYSFGRPQGLGLNPVYLGAHVCAAAGFFAYSFGRSTRWSALAGFAGFAFLAMLTDKRVAALAIVVLAVASGVKAKTWRALALIPTVVGASFLADTLHRVAGSGGGVGQRLADSGMSDRFTIWRFGMRAWLDRPLQGYGLGRFRAATQRYYSDDWVNVTRDNERAWGYLESHNIVVQILVTLGLIGLVLFVAFVLLSLRRSAGPTIWMASGIFVTWMLQPAVLQTWPVALALLGAGTATIGGTRSPRRSPAVSATFVGACVVGALLACSFIVSESRIPTTIHGQGLELPKSSWMFGRDPVVASTMADEAFDPSHPDWTDEERQLVLTWAEHATEYEPDYPFWWGKLGLRRLRYGDLVGARQAAERAIDLQPNDIGGWQVMRIVAQREGDDATLREADAVLCRFELGECAGD